MIVLIEAIIVLVVFEYYVIFVPVSALRSTRSCIRISKACLLGGALVPGGLFFAGKAGATSGVELYARIEEAGYTTAAMVAISLIALFAFNQRYIFLRTPANRRWAERDG
jgi:hypothetical protein